MGIDDLLHDKKDQIHEIAARHGASNVRVFGSVARGEASADSDVDLLVDLTGRRSFFFPGGLIADLSPNEITKLNDSARSLLKTSLRGGWYSGADRRAVDRIDEAERAARSRAGESVQPDRERPRPEPPRPRGSVATPRSPTRVAPRTIPSAVPRACTSSERRFCALRSRSGGWPAVASVRVCRTGSRIPAAAVTKTPLPKTPANPSFTRTRSSAGEVMFGA